MTVSRITFEPSAAAEALVARGPAIPSERERRGGEQSVKRLRHDLGSSSGRFCCRGAAKPGRRGRLSGPGRRLRDAGGLDARAAVREGARQATVEDHHREQHEAVGEEDRGRICPHRAQPVVERREDEDADHHTDRTADAAAEGHTADDRRRGRLEHQVGAELGRGCGEADRDQRARQGGKTGGDHEHDRERDAEAGTGRGGHLTATADRHDVPAAAGEAHQAEDESEGREGEQAADREDAEDRIVKEHAGVDVVGRNDLPAADPVGEAGERHHRADRHDQRRDPEPGGDRRVDETDDDAKAYGAERADDHAGPAELQRDEPRNGDHRPDAEVELPGDHRQRETERDHPEKGEGLHQGVDVVAVDEVGAQDREDCQDPDEQAGPYQERGAAETTHETVIPRGHRFIPPIRAPRITAATTTRPLTAS